MSNKKVLITGGAGYIGSHCVLEMLKQGYDIVVFDNFSTGHKETIEKLLTVGKFEFLEGDLKNKNDLKLLFSKYEIDSVIHFAAFSQVGESMKEPKKYYENNVLGTINLLDTMIENNVKKIVFSSTAATYGEPKYTPIDENHPQIPINPYGNTKLVIEKVMDDYDRAYGLKSVRLRYFNVAGASTEGIVGENHNPETHLIPNVLKASLSDGSIFSMFGNDYNTKDGTCVRDYIDVEDLIDAHIKALKYLTETNKTDYFNLGTNQGNTTKEVFDLCQKVIGKNIKIEIKPRREGDPAILVADNKKAKEILGWEPKNSLEKSINNAYSYLIGN